MVKKKTIAITVAGIGVGTAQTFILREYVDKTYGPIPGLEGLGGFGTYSAIGGLVTGGITTAVGLISVLTGKITTNETIQLGLLGYGIPALTGAVLSGVFPVVPAVELRLRAPATQIKLKAAGITTGRVAQTNRAAQTGQVAPAKSATILRA